MTRFLKAGILGLITGMVGLGASLLPFGFDLEESFGLHLLFKLRGVRRPPSEVMIVSIDKASCENLKLPDDIRKWPRSLHARLIEYLTEKGVAVVIFDVLFEEARSTEEDVLFAEAIRKASNVVLCSHLKSEQVPLVEKGGLHKGDISIVRQVWPIPCLAESAMALAPFPLPKVPIKLSRYWTFKTGAGDTPTLPVVAFQIFALQAYTEFSNLLGKVNSAQGEKLPRNKDAVIKTRGVEKLIQGIREIFESDSQISERMLGELRNSTLSSHDEKRDRIVKSLIKMYQSRDNPYLNFYGPPQTITTVPYHQVLEFSKRQAENKAPDMKGKAVFVGHSAPLPSEQKEGFYTVFSQSNGLDISGVEIAATAFANLLEDRPIRPLSLRGHIITLLLWGIGVGILSYLFSAVFTAFGLIGLNIFYLIVLVYQFKTTGIWFPLTIPFFFQTPFAFFGAVLWKYVDTNRERQNIKKALEYYLPNQMVGQLAKNIADLKATGQLVYGICLWTDASQFTSLSEAMDPKDLGSFMNRYFETVFRPVKQYGGIIANVIGDSMLAIWVAAHPDAALRNKACLAALDIARATSAVKHPSDPFTLPTRIGLHSGHILLGNIGAIDHYEYRPIGDIVNTTTRIESLNKYLGTRILVSEKVIHQLDGFLEREVGEFVLVGKSSPLVVHELIGRREESDEKGEAGCAVFAEALAAFKKQSWDEAIKKFRQSIGAFGEDKPSDFYLKLCEHYKGNPPGEPWNGIIQMDKK